MISFGEAAILVEVVENGGVDGGEFLQASHSTEALHRPLSSSKRQVGIVRSIVQRATVYRWVQKFCPEIAKRASVHRSWRGLNWHVDEAYVRIGGKWRYLWRAVDQQGQFVDFRLTARRDAKAARAFLKQAIESSRPYRPVTICTDKAPGYRKVIDDINHRYDPNFDHIMHIDRKWRNNRIESDHAALKRRLGTRQSFRSLRTAKVSLMAIEAIRNIKNGHIKGRQPGVLGEIAFVRNLFKTAG